MEHNVPMQKDTVFRIYSMTKPITTVAAMILWEEGKFKLDDPVYQYIPEFKGLQVYQATGETVSGRAMTLRDLMRHTSGLTYGWGTDAVEKMYGKKNVLDHNQPLSVMVDKLSGIPLLFNPGEKWNYSVSTDVLGYFVEQVSGKPLDVFFSERIFEPLGMNDTAFYVHPDKTDRFAVNYGPDGNGGLKIVDGIQESRFLKNPAMLSGGGGLVSTAPDYVQFCQMLFNKGTLDGKQILKKETVEMMTQNHLPEGVWTWDAGTGFGLGFSVLVETEGNQEALGEYGWGGMASTHFWILPQQDLAVVALSQIIPYSNQLADAIKQPIYNEIGLEKSAMVEAK
jgi:CubicO group peptidase (beta-lactamase class C family)